MKGRIFYRVKAFGFNALLASTVLVGNPLNTWAEETHPLQSIDFLSTPQSTEIFLHTGSIVPYRTVLASDNKIVVDIDQVNSDQTIRTNFAGAENVSHVVIQPLSSHTVRLIVRGERLGQPALAFKDARSSIAPDNSYLPSPAGFSLPQTPKAEAPITSIQEKTSLPLEKKAELTDLDTSSLTPLQSAEKPIETASYSPSAPASKTTDLPELTKTSAVQKAAAPPESNPLDILKSGPASLFLQMGLIAFVLFGFGMFIYRKWKSLQSPAQRQDWDSLVTEIPQKGRRASFRDLAEEHDAKMGKEISKKASATARTGNVSRPVGLRSLQQFDSPVLEGPELQRNLAPTNRRPAEGTVSKKQVMNQYQKQSTTPPQMPQRRAVSEDILRQEVRMTAQAKSHLTKPSNPGAEPPKKGSVPSPGEYLTQPTGRVKNQQNPLPASNPEVLDFLRSVADLMEKDGKVDAARSIKRQLRTPSK